MAVLVGDFFGGGGEVAVFDFHVGVCLVDDFDEDDELFDVGADNVVESVLDDHAVVDNVDYEALTLDVREFGGDCSEDVGHELAGLVVEPLAGKKHGVVLFEDVHEDDLDYDADEPRNRLVELYLENKLPFCTSLKNIFSMRVLYSSLTYSAKSSFDSPACLRHSLKLLM